jgi:hypothetical protein
MEFLKFERCVQSLPPPMSLSRKRMNAMRPKGFVRMSVCRCKPAEYNVALLYYIFDEVMLQCEVLEQGVRNVVE